VGPPKPEAGAEASAETGDTKTVEQRYQETLRDAAAKGLPVVVVFGSQTAMDTQKQATETLKQNMKDGKAVYMFVDTDKLDPNSDLGKVARRDDKTGRGLGSTGKSDLVFTGVYKVQQNQDGSFSLGDSVATFWGGRAGISATMADQLQYATARRPGPGPDGKPTDTVQPPRPSVDNPNPNGPQPGRDQRPDGQPDKQPQRDPEKQKEDERKPDNENQERARKEEEARKAEAKKKRYKELVSNTTDKGYSLEQYADGWGNFLGRAEMEEGPTKNLTNQLGRQMIMGEFDGKQLAGLMDSVGKTDQATMDKRLEQVNKELAQNGIKVVAKVNPETGRVSEMELASEGKNGEPPTSMRITANGEVISTEGTGTGKKEITASQASIRLAKRSEPAACP
jgi:hypothetical protein